MTANDPDTKHYHDQESMHRLIGLETTFGFQVDPESVIETWWSDASDLVSIHQKGEIDTELQFDLLAMLGRFRRTSSRLLGDDQTQDVVQSLEQVCAGFDSSDKEAVLKCCQPKDWLDAAAELSANMDLAEDPDDLAADVAELVDSIDDAELVAAVLSESDLSPDVFPDLAPCRDWLRNNVGTLMPAAGWLASIQATFRDDEQMRPPRIADTTFKFAEVLARMELWISGADDAPCHRISDDDMIRLVETVTNEMGGADKHTTKTTLRSQDFRVVQADSLDLGLAAAADHVNTLRANAEAAEPTQSIATLDLGGVGEISILRVGTDFKCHLQQRHPNNMPLVSAMIDANSQSLVWHPLPSGDAYHTDTFSADWLIVEIDDQRHEIQLNVDE